MMSKVSISALMVRFTSRTTTRRVPGGRGVGGCVELGN